MAGVEQMGKFQGVGHGLARGVVVEDDVGFSRVLHQFPGPGRQIPQFLGGVQVVIPGSRVVPELKPGILPPPVAAQVPLGPGDPPRGAHGVGDHRLVDVAESKAGVF